MLRDVSAIALAVMCGMASGLVASEGQDPAQPWEALIQQGRAEGLRYAQTRDGRAKDNAKKLLNDAEKLIKNALKQNPACEPCQAAGVATAFMETYFGFAGSYDNFLETAGRAQAQFPLNGRIAVYRASAFYNTANFAEAIKAYKRYLASSGRDRDTDATVQSALADSQQRFLTSWYQQANFYQANESKILRTNPQTFASELVFQVTPEWEVASANQVVPTLAQQAPVVQDPEVQTYLEQLVGKLIGRTPGPAYSYRLAVQNSPAINAVTVPGQIFIDTGLLQFVETEAELAGVLSHELAHNYGHHTARALIKQYYMANLANVVASAVNPQSQGAQAVTALVANLGVGLFVRAYSRFEEKEADLYGTHILYNAGYNPTAMSAFNLKMYQRNPNQPVKFLSTHPPAPDRAEYLTDYLEAFDLSQPLAVDSEAFKKIKLKFPSASRGVLPPP